MALCYSPAGTAPESVRSHLYLCETADHTHVYTNTHDLLALSVQTRHASTPSLCGEAHKARLIPADRYPHSVASPDIINRLHEDDEHQ